MIAHALALSALVRPRQLGPLLTFATRHPRLRVVIAHAGTPAIGAGGSPGWREAMAALAARPNM